MINFRGKVLVFFFTIIILKSVVFQWFLSFQSSSCGCSATWQICWKTILWLSKNELCSPTSAFHTTDIVHHSTSPFRTSKMVTPTAATHTTSIVDVTIFLWFRAVSSALAMDYCTSTRSSINRVYSGSAVCCCVTV